MRTLDYQVGAMPVMIQTVANLSSPHLAVRFARRFGGQRLYFPQKLYTAHPIVRCLGERAATRVCAVWLKETLEVPSATTYLRWIDARALAVAGLSRSAIAGQMGLSLRHTHRLLEGFDPAGIAIDGTVAEIARLYGVSRRRLEYATRTLERRHSGQHDFGWPHIAHGAPIYVG